MTSSSSKLTNLPLDEASSRAIEQALEEGESLLFTIVGDYTAEGTYGQTVLAATGHRVLSYDPTYEGLIRSYAFSDIQSAVNKRMYGNARMNLTMKDGSTVQIFRFSYRVAALCDMCAAFLTHVAEGGDLKEEMEIVEATFEKVMCVCPKCGRTLIRPGAECVHCQSKRKVFGKLIHYVKPHTTLLIISLLLSGITTTIALLPPIMTKSIVDDVIPNPDKQAALKQLGIIVLTLFIAYIIHYSISALRGYMLRVCGDRMVEELRNDVYEKAQHLPMKFYDKTSTGSVINRISGDTNTLQAFMLRVTQEVVVQFFLLIGIIVIMFAMNWKLTLLSLIPVPLVVIGSRIFGKKIAPFYRRIWRRWAAVTSVLTDTIPCVRVIKAFAGEERAVDKFKKYNDEWLKVDIKSARITTAFPNIVSFVVTCGSLLIWAVGGKWVVDGGNTSGLTAGLLVSFISYASLFYGPVNFFANLNDTYQGALASIERIFDILDAEPEPDLHKGNCPEQIKGKIEFRNVNFSFDKTKKVLSDVSFVIEPGDIVGIVGTTGSGKSTLVNLLLRFYDQYEGQILVDGIDLKELDLSYFRSKIGYVQQEPMMFSDTIYNNIAYGVPDAQVEAVIHAADVANAHDFIIKQPDGYDSMLGERGVGLSGGEKQRLSIARAVLKNPSILIFDEATAAVDSETESQIQEAIDRLISGRTTLMIAHRLSTLRKANKILVVDQGKIIENGSHDELMALKGKYYRLIEIQSLSEKLQRDREEANF